jgi:hypothetical protein
MASDARIDTSIETIDRVLAEYRPFGNSSYIHEQLQYCYRHRLTKLSDALPVAGQLAAELDRADRYTAYRVVGDTAVRFSIDEQVRRRILTSTGFGAPLDMCEGVLEETASFLAGTQRRGPLSLSEEPRLGGKPHHGWIWTNNRLNGDVFADAFHYVIKRNYGGQLCTPSPAEVAMLQQGAQLLTELLPLSSHSALSHTHIVGIFHSAGDWGGVASSSQFYVGGTIFLSSNLLRNPWSVAEYLFHESLHQKLYDFRHAHTLLAQDSAVDPDSSEYSSARLLSPWNSPKLDSSNLWDTHRAMAAFHVYVHLALLRTVAEQRESALEETYGPLQDAMTPTRAAFERAHYLGQGIQNSACWAELGRAGQLLVEWLTSILDALDPSPPPRDANVYLYVDRYLREAKSTEGQETTPELSRQLAQLTEDEITSTCGLLDDMDGKAAAHLRASIGGLATQAPDKRFAGVRRVIVDTLRRSSASDYTFQRRSNPQHDPDEMFRAMVERSSSLLAKAAAPEPDR